MIDVLRAGRSMSEDAAVRLLMRFLFDYEQVRRPVATLSGGERTRLAFLLLMQDGANCLLLDEPTNHLDVDSIEVLEDALERYDGTVIAVSHDRYFLDRIADRIVLVADGARALVRGRLDRQRRRAADAQRRVTRWRSTAPPLEASAPRAATADHDRLQLGEALHRVPAADPAGAAVSARAPAERQVVLPVVRGLVDVHEAGAHAVGEAQAVHHVAGEDRRQQAVGRGVGELDRLLERAIGTTGAIGPNVSSVAASASAGTPSRIVACQ